MDANEWQLRKSVPMVWIESTSSLLLPSNIHRN